MPKDRYIPCPNPGYWRCFTKKVMIPLYTGIINWFYNTVPSNANLIFLSRDGYLLYKIIQNLKKRGYFKNWTIHYLPIARHYIKLLFAASVDNQKLFKDFLNERVIRFETKSHLNQRSDFQKTYESYKKQIPLYKALLTKVGIPHTHTFLFEVGWRGTTLFYLYKFIKEAFKSDWEFTPLYIGSLETTPPEVANRQKCMLIEDGKPEHIMAFLDSYIAPFEFLFSAPHGRLDKITPNLTPIWDPIPPQVQKAHRTIEKELLSNIQNIQLISGYTPTADILTNFQLFIRRKHYNDLEQWSKVYMEIGPTKQLYPFVPTLTLQEFNRLSPAKLKTIMQKALWPNTIFVPHLDEKRFVRLLTQKGIYKQFKQDWRPTPMLLLKRLRLQTLIKLILRPRTFLRALWNRFIKRMLPTSKPSL